MERARKPPVSTRRPGTRMETWVECLLPTRQNHLWLNRALEIERGLYNRIVDNSLAIWHDYAHARESGDETAKLRMPSFQDRTNEITGLNNAAATRSEYASIPAFIHHWTARRHQDSWDAYWGRRKNWLKAGAKPDDKPSPPSPRRFGDWQTFGACVQVSSRETVGSKSPLDKTSPVSLEVKSRIGIGGRREFLPTHVRIGGRVIDDSGSRNTTLLRCRIKAHRWVPDGASLRSVFFTSRAVGISRHFGMQHRWALGMQWELLPDFTRQCRSRHAAIGVDVGVVVPLAQSDGGAVALPKSLRVSHVPVVKKRKLSGDHKPPRQRTGDSSALRTEKLARRCVSRAVKGSTGRLRAKLALRRVTAKTSATRKQWAHKQAARLTSSYAIIGVEDLSVKNMTASAKGTVESPGKGVAAKSGLNRAILNTGWSQFRHLLTEKAVRSGSRVIAVPPAYTSQTCPGCSHVTAGNRRSQAEFKCVACGYRGNADVVGAMNIKALALAAASEQNAEAVNAASHGGVAASPDGAGGERQLAASTAQPNGTNGSRASRNTGARDNSRRRTAGEVSLSHRDAAEVSTTGSVARKSAESLESRNCRRTNDVGGQIVSALKRKVRKARGHTRVLES